jgi:uncharacterized protein YneF (UPF0154 family)
MDKKIALLYLHGKNNIGDAFVALGLEYISRKVLKKALDNVAIVKSGSPYGAIGYIPSSLYYSPLKRIIPQKLRERLNYTFTRGRVAQAFEYIPFIDGLKYVIIGGCFLTHYYVKRDLQFLLKLKDKVKILMIGVGGENYSEHEVEEVRKFLSKLRPYLVVTRDTYAYKFYSEYAEFAYDGIDNAYFVSDAFIPPKLNIKYIVINLDHLNMKRLNINIPMGLDIVKLHNITKAFHKRWLKEQNFFISDYPEDYLTLIANAELVYTDRIHTAVVAKSYGRPYQYLGSSIRKAILEKVRGKDLTKLKQDELRFISEVLSKR